MQVLSPKYPGLIFICEQCGMLAGGVQDNEIYEDSYVYCPICKYRNRLQYSKKYDGIIPKEEKKDGGGSQSPESL